MRFDPIPVRGSTRRERILSWAVGLIFAFVILRLFAMQVLQGSRYRELSEENRIRVEVLTAPRGEIRDRRGRLLADNIPSFTVTLDPIHAGTPLMATLTVPTLLPPRTMLAVFETRSTFAKASTPSLLSLGGTVLVM